MQRDRPTWCHTALDSHEHWSMLGNDTPDGLVHIYASLHAGRAGPSAGLEHEMLPVMVNHTIRTYFAGIWERHKGDVLVNGGDAGKLVAMYLDWYREVGDCCLIKFCCQQHHIVCLNQGLQLGLLDLLGL